MKKVVFALFFLSLIFFAVIGNIVFAQEITVTPTIVNQINQTSPSAIIKYDLAFPGLLPDSRFYKLKVLKERISAAIISDPRLKINYYLLQADKGTLATAMLVDKNKFSLAEQTALKAENNFTLISSAYRAYYFKEEGNIPNEKELIKKLKTASLKHQEVFNSLLKRVPKENQKTFIQVIDFSKRNINTIENMKKEYEFHLKQQNVD